MKLWIQMKNNFDISNQHNFPMLIHVSYVEILMEKNYPRKWAWPILTPFKNFY